MAQSVITVNVLSDTSKFNVSGVNKDLEKMGTSSEKSATKLQKLGNGFKAMAVPALAIVGALGAIGVAALKAAEEAAVADAKLTNAFKNAGFEENAAAAKKFAENLGLVTGISDEAIKNTSGILTQNSALAENIDLLNLTTEALYDYAAVNGESADSVAKKWTKIWAAPETSLKKLKKMGIEFTKEEEKRYNALIKAGKYEEAQAMATNKLYDKNKGAAEASTTAAEKLQNAFGEIIESLGTFLLPYMETLVEYATKFTDWASEHTGLIVGIAAAIGTLAAVIITVNAAMTAWTAVMTAWTAVQAISTAVQMAWNTALYFGLAPILLVVAAIAALIAIGVLLYKNWDTITAWLSKTWDSIKKKAVDVWNAIKKWFADAWNAIKDKTIEIWNNVKTWLSNAWDSIKTKVSDAFNAMKSAVSTALNNIITFVKELPGKILAFYANFYTFLFQKGKDLITGMFNGLKNAWTTARDWLSEIGSKALSALGNLGSVLFNKGKSLVQGLINGIKSMAGKVVDVLLGLIPGPLKGVVGNLLGRSIDLPIIELRDSGLGRIGGGFTFVQPTTVTNSGGSTTPSIITYNIEVSTMVADRQAGKHIVSAIKQYENSTGTGWRR